MKFVNDFDFKNVKRFYQVENFSTKQIRAWHGHKKESKYIYVTKGTFVVGVVNLSTEEVQRFVLSSLCPKILFVPPGYANGTMNLEPDSIITFFSTSTLEESKNDDIRFPWHKWDIWEITPR